MPLRKVTCQRCAKIARRRSLDLLQHGFTPLAVELARLLQEQRVYIGIAAVDVGAALRHEGFETRGSVVGRAAKALDQVLEACRK